MHDGAIHFITHHILTSSSQTKPFLFAIVISTVLFVALMFALHRLSPQGKKWATIICTFVAGLFLFLEYLLPVKTMTIDGQTAKGNFVTPYLNTTLDFIMFVFIWPMFLGLISLGIVHGRRIVYRVPGWHNSVAFFVALLGIVAVGYWSQLGDSKIVVANNWFDSLYTGLLVNFDAAMFSLLAFYIASAAFRAFRVRSVESALLMFAALIVMLGWINFGVWITSAIPADSHWAYFRVERLSGLILNWVNMPTLRAVGIGVAVGELAIAMRLWLSLERGSFFSQE